MDNIRQSVARIKAFRAGILEKYQETPLFQRSLADVKRVVIINSSSRSGSSLLYTLLAKLPDVYALTGEAAPFYKLNTCLESFNLFESDKIPPDLIDQVIDYSGLSRDFFSDLYLSGNSLETAEIEADEYIDHLLLRFALQWTGIDFEETVLRCCIGRAFDQYARENRQFHTPAFYLQMLQEVVTEYPGVNPFYYDISTDRVALRFPFTDVPNAPPNAGFNIEEPPFILQQPRRKVSPLDLAEKSLLLKSTVDCYRMNLIDRIFPNAEIRIIHLTRNPAATTNGIYDGWLHRGFFSHNLQPYFDGSTSIKELQIGGYSELTPHGRTWWNFDLPEGWPYYANRELIDVCAFQWHSANAEILDYLSRSARKSCRVRFEEIMGSSLSRHATFETILAFMGIGSDQLPSLELDHLPVVQSTLPPQLYRWKKRRDIISRLLDDPNVIEMSNRLGYNSCRFEEWL